MDKYKKLVIGLAVAIGLVVAFFIVKNIKENTPPSGLTKEEFRLGKRVLEVANAYADFKITKDEALEQIEGLSSHLDYLSEQGSDHLFLSISISFLDSVIMSGGDIYDAIEELEDDL